MKKLLVGIVLTILLATAVFVVMEHTLASAIAGSEATPISPPVEAFIEANIEAVEAAKERGSFGFEDVLPDHWAYEEIELIHSYGITVGCSYDPPLYCPDRPMTRAEAAVFAARILEMIDVSR